MFPISKYLPELGPLVQENQALQLIAPTGTGKSIDVPPYLVSLGETVLVSVPTVVTARSLYNYQQEIHPEIRVGYAAEGEIKYDSKTQIIYATSGHVYRLLLRREYPSTVLFVDEVHTQSADITLIISLYLFHYESGLKVPRLLLVSATPTPLAINPPIWAPDFTSPYTVDVKYQSTDIPTQDLMKVAAETANKIGASASPGDVLIFAPGKREISQVVERLDHSKYDVFSLHAEVDKWDRDRLFKPSPKRKVIVATNIAETSLTIPNIGYVIDTLLEKVSEISPANAQRLVTTKVSKDSADQRKGRTGRTNNGVCYRLISQDSYEKLPQHRVAEIYRVPLASIVIQLLSHGYDPEEVLDGLGLTAQIATAQDQLTSLGLIKGTSVTPAGRFVPKLNLSVKNATLVYRWTHGESSLKNSGLGLLVACLVESENLGGTWVGDDDLASAALVWTESRKVGAEARETWAREHQVDYNSFRELQKKVEQVEKMTKIKAPNSISPEELNLARQDLQQVYKRVVYLVSAGAVLVYRDRVGANEVNFALDPRSVNNYKIDPPAAVLVLQLVEISGKLRVPFSIRVTYDETGTKIVSPYATGGVNKEVSASGLSKLAALNKVLTKKETFVVIPSNVYPDNSKENSIPSLQLLHQLAILE